MNTRRFSILALALTLATAQAAAGEQFRAGLTAGTTVPTSDFGEFFSTGISGTGHFAYEINPGIFFTLSAGYARWEVDGQALSDAIIPAIGLPQVSLAAEGSLRSIPLMIGVRYSPLTRGIQPYLALEAGLHLLSLELSGSITTGPNVTPLAPVSDSRSEFGLSAGIGVDIPLARQWLLEVSAMYVSVERADLRLTDPSDPTGADVSADALRSYGFQAGVVYAF